MSVDAARVLIVEDDWLVAQVAAAAVRCSGSVVIGPFPCANEAESRLEACHADAALLDVNVVDGTTFDLARKLRKAGVRMVFHSNWPADRLPKDLADVPLVPKSHGPAMAVAKLIGRS